MKKTMPVLLAIVLVVFLVSSTYSKDWKDMTIDERRALVLHDKPDHQIDEEALKEANEYWEYWEYNPKGGIPSDYGEAKVWSNLTLDQKRTIIWKHKPEHQIDEEALKNAKDYWSYWYGVWDKEHKENEKRWRKEKEEREKKERAELERRIAKYPESIKQAIRKKSIVLGVTKEQVVLSWGKPDDINRHVGSWGVHEQWVYGQRTYLYFESGILTSWQKLTRGGETR